LAEKIVVLAVSLRVHVLDIGLRQYAYVGALGLRGVQVEACSLWLTCCPETLLPSSIHWKFIVVCLSDESWVASTRDRVVIEEG
jgi:hypothetical protein